jgi:3-hydroxybutyryl-CoA dehydratase
LQKGKQSIMSEDTQRRALLPMLGERATRKRTITEDDVLLFAQVSGDHNPIHLDEEYAAASFFGRRIVHGSLVASLISAVLGNDLPGHGSIYLGQTLKFVAPVHIGDTITVSVETIAVREEKRLVTLHTECVNQDGKSVLVGEATIKYP